MSSGTSILAYTFFFLPKRQQKQQKLKLRFPSAPSPWYLVMSLRFSVNLERFITSTLHLNFSGFLNRIRLSKTMSFGFLITYHCDLMLTPLASSGAIREVNEEFWEQLDFPGRCQGSGWAGWGGPCTVSFGEEYLLTTPLSPQKSRHSWKCCEITQWWSPWPPAAGLQKGGCYLCVSAEPMLCCNY